MALVMSDDGEKKITRAILYEKHWDKDNLQKAGRRTSNYYGS